MKVLEENLRVKVRSRLNWTYIFCLNWQILIFIGMLKEALGNINIIYDVL